MKVIKENLLLSMGILLPFLLMLIFMISATLTKSTLPPPQHSFLFTTTAYDRISQDPGIYFVVKNNQLTAQISKQPEGPDAMRIPTENQRLYFYDAGTQTTDQISAEIDNDIVKLARFKNATLDTKTTAPDGYEFTNLRYRNTGLIGDIFGVNRYNNNEYYLVKQNAVYPVKLPYSDNRYHDVRFLGWVNTGE